MAAPASSGRLNASGRAVTHETTPKASAARGAALCRSSGDELVYMVDCFEDAAGRPCNGASVIGVLHRLPRAVGGERALLLLLPA